VIDAEEALPGDADAVVGQACAPAARGEVPDVEQPQREQLGDPATAMKQVGSEQPIVAQLIRLTDRLRAQPELVRVRRRRGRSEHGG
jgi:hypothetical protein